MPVVLARLEERRGHRDSIISIAPNRFMTHLAMLEVDDEGNSATWGEHVTDEEYGQQPG